MSIQLSVCMIIKNENSTLRKCLSSIQLIADEIIIVDTGSTDNSKEIAKEFTTHVYDYIWESDFSKARNESIKHATGKWIMIIDADEYIAPEDLDKYRDFFRYTEPSPNLVYTVTINSFLESTISNSEVGRIFPNGFGFHFHRPIHEQLKNSAPEKLRSAHSNLILYHTGYLQETRKSKNKSERNMAIIKQLKERGKLSSYDHFNLANEYSMQNDTLIATYHYLRSFKAAKISSPWRLTCGYQLYYIYAKANRFDKAYQILEQMFVTSSNSPDEFYLRAAIYNQLGFTELAKQNCEQSYNLANKLANKGERFYSINADFVSTLPINMLLNISKASKNYSDIIYYSTKLLQADRRNVNAIYSIVNSMITHNEAHNIFQLFNKILGKRDMIEDFIILNCCLNMGYVDILSNINIPKDYEIPIDSQLLISLIRSDHDMFISSTKKLTSEKFNNNILTSIIVGSLVLNQDFYKSIQPNIQPNLKSLEQLYNIIYNNESYDITDIKLQHAIVDFLSMLFITGHDRLYNEYIQKFNDPSIINLLGRFFYTNNYTDIALSYFSDLIENNDLVISNALLLGQLHLNQGYIDDAINFYQYVIKNDPSEIQAYIKIITNTDDPQLRISIKRELLKQNPRMKKINFINNY